MRPLRVLGIIVMLGLLIGGALAHPARGSAAQTCFDQTNQCIQGRFLDHWLANGGLARNGYPLGPEVSEQLEDGKIYTVQYFERARFELHPENPAPYDVLLGQFGRRILRESYHVARAAYAGAVAPATPVDGQTYFPETGHNLGGRFLAYWEANGGLAQFGYPITEERYDGLGPGSCCVTQYFERARFEYHPENAGTPYEVLLGQFGRRIQAENDLLNGVFARRFITDEGAQVRLGAPVSRPVETSGATQPFERGRMFYAADAPPQNLIQGGFLALPTRPVQGASAAATVPPPTGEPTIYVLCGNAEYGEVRASSVDFTYFWRDTWDESQPAGGGPGPRPGLSEPTRGFGKVWRDQVLENGVTATGAGQCLGYATATETGFAITVQYFAGGALLLSDTAEGRYLYILTVGRNCNSCAPTGTYERLPLAR